MGFGNRKKGTFGDLQPFSNDEFVTMKYERSTESKPLLLLFKEILL